MSNQYVTNEELKKYSKWYYSSYFAIALSFFGVYIIPLAIALFLQYKKNKFAKKCLSFYPNVIGHEDEIIKIFDFNKKIISLEDEYKNKEETFDAEYSQRISKLNADYKSQESKLSVKLSNDIKSLKLEINNLSELKSELTNEIDSLESKAMSLHFDFSNNFNNITSEEFKNKLSMSKISEEQKLKNDELIIISNKITDKKFLKNNSKQVMRLFNSECENIMARLTVQNIDGSRNKITRSFNSLNKLFETDGIQLSNEWLEIKLDQLNTMYLYELKKSQEKEVQKAIKEQMIEEEKVRREIEKQKSIIEKDQKQFNNEITRMMKYLQKSSNDADSFALSILTAL